jgi:hypothetical protein
VGDLAKRRLADAQALYKKKYDRTIREKNKELDVGSWVFVRREVHDTVLGSDGHVLILQQGVDKVRVSADRVTPATTPTPMPSTPLLAPPPEPADNSESPPAAEAQVPEEVEESG